MSKKTIMKKDPKGLNPNRIDEYLLEATAVSITHVIALRKTLQDFVENVKWAYGTGKGNQIDAMHMDWPDLGHTYEEALVLLGFEAPNKKPRKKRKL